jgi:hypothetical protein
VATGLVGHRCFKGSIHRPLHGAVEVCCDLPGCPK